MAKITNIFTRLIAAIKFVYEHTTIEPVVFFLNFSLNVKCGGAIIFVEG